LSATLNLKTMVTSRATAHSMPATHSKQCCTHSIIGLIRLGIFCNVCQTKYFIHSLIHSFIHAAVSDAQHAEAHYNSKFCKY